jgi:hypothetical protein
VSGENTSIIYYVYVSGNVTLSRDKVPFNGDTYEAFNFGLETGWNLVQRDSSSTEEGKVYTYKIADTDVPWIVDNRGGGDEGETKAF